MHGKGGAEPQTQAPSRTLPEASYRSAWARLIAQLYEVAPLVCPKCSSAMRVLAIITDPAEVKKILRHLVKTGRPPPDLDPSALN